MPLSAMFPAAERGFCSMGGPFVNAYDAEFQSFRRFYRRREVVGEYISGQSVFGIIGFCQGIVQSVEREQGQHRAEDLLTRQYGRLVEACYHSRLHEISFLRGGRDVAAGEHLRLLRLCCLQQSEYAVPLPFGNQGAYVDPFFETAAHLQLGDMKGEPLCEKRVDGFFHIKSLRGDTDLSVITETGDGCGFSDGFHVYVSKYEHGGGASQYYG